MPNYAYAINATGDIDVLQQQHLAIPALSDDTVLVRNHAASVNFIDTIIRRGAMPQGMMPALPHIPGVEGAGIVEKVGNNVTGLQTGDKVAWMGPIGAGGYATHSAIPAHGVVKLSPNIDLHMAASLPVNAMTAWHMLHNLGNAQSGQSILVHAAAGGVGTLALQLARHLGLTVIASVSSGKMDYALAQGADHVVDYTKENLVERVMTLTNGRGVDLTLNPVAGDSLKADFEMLAPLGTAILFGFLSGPPAGNFAEDLARHFNKSIAGRVSDIYTWYGNQPAAFRQDMTEIFALQDQGVLKPSVEILPIDAVGKAHSLLETGKVTGKLVLDIPG